MIDPTIYPNRPRVPPPTDSFSYDRFNDGIANLDFDFNIAGVFPFGAGLDTGAMNQFSGFNDPLMSPLPTLPQPPPSILCGTTNSQENQPLAETDPPNSGPTFSPGRPKRASRPSLRAQRDNAIGEENNALQPPPQVPSHAKQKVKGRKRVFDDGSNAAVSAKKGLKPTSPKK